MSAACGPYCMSWGMRESAITTKTTVATPAAKSPKYTKRHTAMTVMRIRYIDLRPITSGSLPNKGIVMKDTSHAVLTDQVRKGLSSLVANAPDVNTYLV